jgi:hypothetical protein
MARAIGRPLDEGTPGRLRCRAQLLGERGAALEVDRDHRTAAADLLTQQRQQGRRLAGAGGAQDQTVGRECALGDLHRPTAAVAPDRDRRTQFSARGDLEVACPDVLDRAPGSASQHGRTEQSQRGRRRHRHQHDECDRRPGQVMWPQRSRRWRIVGHRPAPAR